MDDEQLPWEGEPRFPEPEYKRGRLTTNAQAEKFIKAGNATITIVSHKSGHRYTYKINKPEDFDEARPLWFVSTLKGSDNERDFGYIGQIVLRGGIFKYIRGRKCWSSFFLASDGFEWAWKQITFRTEPDIHPAMEIWHEGRCGRCGRKLTVPESIESGFGPECITHV